jgi:hypothetical protein
VLSQTIQGTTLIYLATEAYSAYAHATGAVFDDQDTHLLSITKEQYKALKPLTFNMGSAGSHTLSPNAQIWPRALNSLINGTETGIYLVVQDVSCTFFESHRYPDRTIAWGSVG